jgi:hypothetical protein
MAALPVAEFESLVSGCPAHDEELRKSGRVLMQESLDEPALSRCIRPKNGRPLMTDGPFAETKEQVGGFFMIEAKDMDEAMSIASKHPAAHLGEQVGWGIEVRPLGVCGPRN